jgi:uncharacterized LabA/DUF88 family protein
MGHAENLSIGVFIDGGYFAKIDEGLAKKNMGKVNVKGLFQYIPEMISKQFGVDRNLLYITEAHYYRGRFKATDAENRNLLLQERQFEDTLIENDIIFHYKHLRPLESGGIIEKGIDTWFALDTYELTLYRDFDYVVLISGDADHEMLARKLKALKTHSILLTWDPAHTGSTSRFLSEEFCTHIDIMKEAGREPDILNKLTIK